MNILKYVVVFFFILFISGCAIYPGVNYNGYIYQKYRNTQSVKKAYKNEQKKITIEEKSIAKCFARNEARINSGLSPGYICTGNYYGGYYNSGYYNSYAPDYYTYSYPY